MLEYVKLILQKVSFDRYLFEKELRKALVMLSDEEIEALKKWCQEHFVQQYSMVLHSIFRLTPAK